MKVLPVNFEESRQSLGFFFIELKFCKSDFYSLNSLKNVRWPLIASVRCSPLMSLRRKFIFIVHWVSARRIIVLIHISFISTD